MLEQIKDRGGARWKKAMGTTSPVLVSQSWLPLQLFHIQSTNIASTKSYRKGISFDRPSVELLIRAQHTTKCHTRRVLRGQADEARPPGSPDSHAVLIREAHQ